MAREKFTTTIESKLLEDIKILAIRKKCSTNDLIEEAITDLLKKYEGREKSRKNLKAEE